MKYLYKFNYNLYAPPSIFSPLKEKVLSNSTFLEGYVVLREDCGRMRKFKCL